MTRKEIIALADTIREHQQHWRITDTMQVFSQVQIASLADFCRSQNQNFKRATWLDYIAGKCGPRGGKLK